MNRKKDLYFFNNNNFTPTLKRTYNKYEKLNVTDNIAKPLKGLSTDNIARPIKRISDAEGLTIAYKTPSGQYIYGDTLFLSGTRNMRDVYDDITKVPTFSVNRSQKYIDTENLINSSAGGGIKSIVAHSLGGRVAQTLKNNYPNRDFKVTTYASPDISINNTSDVTRYRNEGDYISILDRSAKIIGSSSKPLTAHSFANSPNTSVDTGGWVIGKTHDTPWDPKTSIFTTPPITQEDLNKN